MFSASVAQNPTIAVSDGQNVGQNWPVWESSNTGIDGFGLLQDGRQHGGRGMGTAQREGAGTHGVEFGRKRQSGPLYGGPD
ncbi:hypothetical protein GCM10025794_23550 [Massilia kyonggiensis]